MDLHESFGTDVSQKDQFLQFFVYYIRKFISRYKIFARFSRNQRVYMPFKPISKSPDEIILFTFIQAIQNICQSSWIDGCTNIFVERGRDEMAAELGIRFVE